MRKFILWVLGAIITGILLPAINSIMSGQISPDSILGRLAVAIYPAPIRDRVVRETPPVEPQVPPSPNTVGMPPSTLPAVMQPSLPFTPMAVTPANASITASLAPPVVRNSRSIQITVYLNTAVDGFPVFFPREQGLLSEWSATDAASGASCSVDAGNSNGLRSFEGEEWKTAGPNMTRLPAKSSYPIKLTLVCTDEIAARQTIIVRGRVDTIINGQVDPIRFTSNPAVLVSPAR